MARWDEHERRVETPFGSFPIDHGYIDLSMPVLLTEREAQGA
jgi:hypothetical protein